jgi:hypothetical protein
MKKKARSIHLSDKMSGESFFFVYGLLMSGGTGSRSFGLDRLARIVGTARVAGQLYDLGDSPDLFWAARA